MAAYRHTGAFILRNPQAERVTVEIDLVDLTATIQGCIPVRFDKPTT